MSPRRRTYIGSAVVVAAACLVVVLLTVDRADSLCDDLQTLVDASHNEFASLDADYRLDDESRCEVFADVESSTLICDWAHQAGSDDARAQVDELLLQVRSCVGEDVDERLDQLVNHPDYYESVYFELPRSVVSVSLKNKNALQKTYVSIGVESTD